MFADCLLWPTYGTDNTVTRHVCIQGPDELAMSSNPTLYILLAVYRASHFLKIQRRFQKCLTYFFCSTYLTNAV